MSEEIDLAEFRRQKQVLTQMATQQVASKIESIRQLVKEIKELAELTDIKVELGDLDYEIRQLNEDWRSSSYRC